MAGGCACKPTRRRRGSRRRRAGRAQGHRTLCRPQLAGALGRAQQLGGAGRHVSAGAPVHCHSVLAPATRAGDPLACTARQQQQGPMQAPLLPQQACRPSPRQGRRAGPVQGKVAKQGTHRWPPGPAGRRQGRPSWLVEAGGGKGAGRERQNGSKCWSKGGDEKAAVQQYSSTGSTKRHSAAVSPSSGGAKLQAASCWPPTHKPRRRHLSPPPSLPACQLATITLCFCIQTLNLTIRDC